jgi:histidinol dehydrogenase
VKRVDEIIEEVRIRGGRALFDYTKRFDGVELRARIPLSAAEAAFGALSEPLRKALLLAAGNIGPSMKTAAGLLVGDGENGAVLARGSGP